MWREEEKKYKCPKCQDKEMYYVSKPDYSGMVWCECHKVREAERMMSKSGLSREIQEKRFDNFDDTDPWQKEIKTAAIEYGKACMKAKSEGRPLPWFFISGQPGCGKTHLCTALCGAFLKKGIPVQYMQWVREARRMKSIVMERDYESEFQKFVDCEMLYIDDLLKQSSKANGLNPNEADGRLLFEILNQRLLEKKPTIISSEWRLMDDLMVYDDGIFSRVWEMADSGRFAIGVARGEDRNYRLKGKTKDEWAD